MYSLNINFLKDRPEFQSGKPAAEKGKGGGISLSGQAPLILGVVVGLALPAAVGGGYAYLLWAMNNLNQSQIALDEDLAVLQQDLEKAAVAERTTTVINEQTDALAGVFNRVKSWAATLEDIRDRLPEGVQLESVVETPPTDTDSTPAPSPAVEGEPAAAVPPPPRSTITITGYSDSVDKIGEFVLLLRSSPYLDPDATRLVVANIVDNPAQVNRREPEGTAQTVTEGSSYTIVNPEVFDEANAEVGELPQLLEYTIETAYTTKPADELIQALDRSSATGLVVRLEAIRNIRGDGAAAPSPATGDTGAADDSTQQQQEAP